MRLSKKFLLFFAAMTFSGLLYLRWLALAFLYRDLGRYWTGIGASLLSTFALLVAVSIPIGLLLRRFERVPERIKGGEPVSPEEKAAAIGAFKRVGTLVILTNLIGFFFGQILVLVIEISQGVLDLNMPRLGLTVLQAIFVGAIAALFEIYTLDGWMAESRRLLKIQDIAEFGREGKLTISGRIALSSAVSLGFMGVNALSASFALIAKSGAPAPDPMAAYLVSGAESLAATFVPCFLLIRVISSELKSRVSGLSERIQKLGEAGDLSSRIYLSMNDDLGGLTSRLNGLLDQLSALIGGLQGETRSVGDTARRLQSSTDESKLALGLMRSSVEKIVSEGERQNKRIDEADRGIQGIAENAKDVEQQVLVQSAAIEQSSASANEMAASVNSVAGLAGKAETLSIRLRESSSGGEASIRSAINAIGEIKEASEEVQAIIQSIQKIASQTNLLSMNAAIEAAHAGDSGAGFAVVASEVGVLATSSSQSAKNIQARIKDMAAKIDRGVAAISEAGKAFSEINAGVEQTSALIDTISRAMEEQRSGAEETLQSTGSIVEAIGAIKRLSSQQREYSEKVAAAMGSLVDSAKAIELALRENADNSASLAGAVENVGACVSDTNEAIARMKRQIDVFKLEEEAGREKP